MADAQPKVTIVADDKTAAAFQKVLQRLSQVKEQGATTSAKLDDGFAKNRDSVDLLAHSLGVGIPRELKKIIAQSSLVGPALGAAFKATAALALLGVVVQLIDKIPELTDKIAGFGEAAKKELKDAADQNKRLLDLQAETKKLLETGELIPLEGSARERQAAEQRRRDLANTQDELLRKQEALNKATERFQFLLAQKNAGVIGEGGQFQEAETEVKTLGFEVKDLEEKTRNAFLEFKNVAEGAERATGKERQADAKQFAADLERLTGILQNVINRGFSPLDEKHNELAQVRAIFEQFPALRKEYGFAEAQVQREITDLIIADRKREVDELEKLLEQANKAVAGVTLPGAGLPNLGPLPGQGIPSLNADRSAAELDRLVSNSIAMAELADQVYQQTRTNAEILAQEQAKLNALYAAGLIDVETYNRAMQKLSLEHTTLGNIIGSLESAFENLFTGVALGTQSLSQAFKNMGAAIIAELSKIITKMLVLALVQRILGALLPSVSADSTNSPFSGSVWSDPLSFPTVGPPKAVGGAVSAGRLYRVNELGMEYFRPNVGGTVLPLGSHAGGGAPPVSLEVHNHGSEKSVTTREPFFDGRRWVVQMVMEDIESNGPLRGIIGGR
jgi:hypothetical protein